MVVTSKVSLIKEDIPNNVFRVFVSSPMAGKGDDEIKQEQKQCFQNFCSNNPKLTKCELMDTIVHAGGPLASLGISMIYMQDADVVVFHPDWNSARGCQIEHLIAEKYNKMIYHAKI